MKKFIISLILLIPFVSGCTSIDTRITINKDNSAYVSATLLYDGNLKEDKSYNSLTIINNYSKFLDNDYVVKKKNTDKSSSIAAFKKVKNIKKSDLDLSSLGFKSNLPNGRFVNVKKNFLITLYQIDMSYDYPSELKKVKVATDSDIDATIGGLKPEYYQKFMQDDAETESLIDSDEQSDFEDNVDESVLELEVEDSEEAKNTDNTVRTTFSIKLPSLASYNNADKTAGDLYVWNIKKDSPTNIKLQYIVYSGYAISLLILSFLIFLIYIARRISRHDSLKRIGSGN